MPRGRLITFEGVEGCGKSTQVALLHARLHERGVAVITTREPGGTLLGERVRELLLHPGSDLTALAELFLLEAARAQLVDRVIAPALASGTIVLADRFADSSVAYQGFARRLGAGPVRAVNQLACTGLVPDRTVVLVVPVPLALGRARRRASTTADNSRFEDEAEAFHQRVAEGYLRLAEEDPQRVRLIDAAGAPEEVHLRALAQLGDLLP